MTADISTGDTEVWRSIGIRESRHLDAETSDCLVPLFRLPGSALTTSEHQPQFQDDSRMRMKSVSEDDEDGDNDGNSWSCIRS